MSFGKVIAKRRKSLGYTQEELAFRLKVSKSAVGKWETDGGIPARENLYRLSEILQIPIAELHGMIAGNTANSFSELNITKDVLIALESYGYKVVKKDD